MHRSSPRVAASCKTPALFALILESLWFAAEPLAVRSDNITILSSRIAPWLVFSPTEETHARSSPMLHATTGGVILQEI
jgi:hypothetical protein